jgi:general secretion pathway protein K
MYACYPGETRQLPRTPFGFPRSRCAAVPEKPARIQRGIALVLVLWIVALLTIIAIGMTSAQRTESTLAANQLGSAHFRALADAAIHFAALNLTARPSIDASSAELEADSLWIPDGQPHTWRFSGEDLEIAIVNVASLIDLNQAPRELLGGLLGAVGIEEEVQAELLDAILDWRDEDDLHLLNGAEDADYESAGRPYGAKDGPFHSVEELLQVLGIDAPLFRELASALTVASASANVQQELAPPLVRAALEGVTIEEMEEMLLEAAAADIPGSELAPIDRGGPLYRIRISQANEDGTARSMEALVRVRESERPPVATLWRRFSLRVETAVAGEAGEQAER